MASNNELMARIIHGVVDRLAEVEKLEGRAARIEQRDVALNSLRASPKFTAAAEALFKMVYAERFPE